MINSQHNMTSNYFFIAPSFLILDFRPFLFSACFVLSVTPFITQAQYDLSDPDGVFKMPDELKEISGLSLSECGQYILTIQDESGTLYWIDKQTGAVAKTTKFWDEGDFEGIEFTPAGIFAIKSNGGIYRLRDWDKPEFKVDKFKFNLEKENDVEGLAYDPAHNRLLLACKGLPANPSTIQRDIFAFDLATEQLSPAPVYSITLEAVNQYLDTHQDIPGFEKIAENFRESAEELGFKPSGIAVHPLTDELFLLSSSGKMLMSMSRTGGINQIIKLDKKMHPQPEGICFDPTGVMYICNEAREGAPGRVYMYLGR